METDHADELVFYVNGKKIGVRSPNPETTLLQFLRRNRLTGTKNVCDQGGCGGCTVMLSKFDWTRKKIAHFTVNSCLTPICCLHGYAVTTVEGVGSTRHGLHPIQKSLVESHGMQCGFCTPGMVMTMYCLIRNNPRPTQEQVERALEGNLCRCTGYRPIIDAFKQFLQDCPLGKECCKNKTTDVDEQIERNSEDNHGNDKIIDSQDPIFPPELQLDSTYQTKDVKFRCEKWTWYRPSSLLKLKDLMKKYPDALLTSGATSVVYALKANTIKSRTIISCTNVKELTEIKETEKGLLIGAAVTFGELEETLMGIINNKENENVDIFRVILKCIRWIAADQVRNVATIGGHIISADPLSDMNPVLMTIGAKVQLHSGNTTREVEINQSFFTGQYKTVVRKEEVLVSVFIPILEDSKDYHIDFYKQSWRRGFDYAIVNACLAVKLDSDNVIKDMKISFGGLCKKTLAVTMVPEDLRNKKFDDELLASVNNAIITEFSAQSTEPQAEDKYRLTLALSMVFKFFIRIREVQLAKPDSMPQGLTELSMQPCKGIRVFENVDEGQPDQDSVGRPIPHVAAESMVSGEAEYVDDIPPYQNELYLGLVLSSKAHAEVISIDTTEAMKVAGVMDYVDHNDIPGQKVWGAIAKDQDLFAVNKVVCIGQTIGAIVATDRDVARKAAKLVRIEYKELSPIITIQEAIEAGSYFDPEIKPIRKGDLDQGFKEAFKTIEGELATGYQEHFYLEPIAAIAIPKREQKEITILAPSQSPGFTQSTVSSLLDIPNHKVYVHTRRAGGAFGGKETGCIYAVGPAAIAAYKTGEAVRCVLDRKEDILMTGKRHPFICRYKVGFSKDGRILAVDVEFYLNGGYSQDFTVEVCENAMYCFDSCYTIPNIKINGHICRTNTPSNTGLRGFGHPQSVYMMENIIMEIAITLGIPQDKVREVNMYSTGDTTPYGEVLTECNISKCWYNCKEQSNYTERKQEIENFNKKSKWKKKGICITPMKFVIGFPLKFLNQAGALVNVYTDGSVLISHSGVEMGQGIHTKMVQVASRALGLPISKIYISETSTNTIPNTMPTSASTGSDLNGEAILEQAIQSMFKSQYPKQSKNFEFIDACRKIQKRLDPYKRQNPEGKWEDWVLAAFLDRVSLSATGFGKPYESAFSHNPAYGVPYFTFGSACSEVEVDCLTGEHQLLRTDIVMDVGKSLNPAIDIGQIEGGFMQGYGMMTTERLDMSPNGQIKNSSSVTYKIPGVRNVPREFRITLLKDSSNEKAIYSSKGIGEPPMLLSISVMLAIKEAILSARKDSGLTGNIRLDAPVTADKIRLACEDKITALIKL